MVPDIVTGHIRAVRILPGHKEWLLIKHSTDTIMALDRAIRNGGNTGSVHDDRGILVF